ncbi:MAG: hypothetical protein AAGJ18_07870, partial [Bacteroidota bacterium]
GLILDYIFGNNPFPLSYRPGNVFVGNAVFYPSNGPLRIAIKDKTVLDRRIKRIVGFPNFTAYLDFYAKNLAANPWQLAFPCSIENVEPVLDKDQLYLKDQNAHLIPLQPSPSKKWKILATSGGHPVNVFGEWSGERLQPLGLTLNMRFIIL